MSSSHQAPKADAETDPDHDQLCREIRIVRTRGFGNLTEAASDLPGLCNVAGVIGSGTDEVGKIEDAVKQAVQRLGGTGTAAIKALLGATQETRGLGVKERRERAAALYDFKAYEVFRTRFEPSLLMFVATYLRVLVDEWRLAAREHVVARAERTIDGRHGTPGKAATDQRDHMNDIWNIPVLPPIYHLRLTRRGSPDAWAYSIRRAPVNIRIEGNTSNSKLKRLLKGSRLRYQIIGRWGTLIYRPPNWFVRSYRAFVTKRL